MQILLSTPKTIEKPTFIPKLEKMLQTGRISVLLVRQGEFDVFEYKALVNSILPTAQGNGCAILLDNQPQYVRELRTDGVQISTGHEDVLKAISALKPEFIVGAANLTSRHEAMLCGEAGADYVSFGNFDRVPDEVAISLANWWADLFEIPCALFDPKTPLEEIEEPVCEFLGLGENIWQAEHPLPQVLEKIGAGHKVSQ